MCWWMCSKYVIIRYYIQFTANTRIMRCLQYLRTSKCYTLTTWRRGIVDFICAIKTLYAFNNSNLIFSLTNIGAFAAFTVHTQRSILLIWIKCLSVWTFAAILVRIVSIYVRNTGSNDACQRCRIIWPNAKIRMCVVWNLNTQSACVWRKRK